MLSVMLPFAMLSVTLQVCVQAVPVMLSVMLPFAGYVKCDVAVCVQATSDVKCDVAVCRLPVI